MYLLLSGFTASSEKIVGLCRIQFVAKLQDVRQTEPVKGSPHQIRHNPGSGMLPLELNRYRGIGDATAFPLKRSASVLLQLNTSLFS